jgi:LPXTG-motif cell wall-anchored protein
MRRQGHFISGLVAFVVTAIAVVGLNGLAGLASAEAGGGGSSPHVECAPYTNYWKLDVPSSTESNVANDAVVYQLANLVFTYTVRSDLAVAKIVVKGGQTSTVHSNSGVLQLPSNVSHITFCLDTPRDTTTTTAPPETTTTTAPPDDTTTTTAPPENTTTTTDPGAECPAGWGEVLPHQPAHVTVELPGPGTWTLTGYGSNENESANEGELWFVGYGTFPAPTTTPLVYDLGEVTVDAPTTLTIVVRPVGRLSVCVSASAELVADTTTTTAPPDDTTTTTAPPDDTTTTTAPPDDTTTTTAPPETTTTTAPPPTIGAAVAAECDNDTPWLIYDIDANGLGQDATVRFANAAGTAEYRVPAGSGRLLWPGAVLDSDGNPIDWPGWDQDADGTWYLNPDNPYMWARRPVSITIEVQSPVAGSTALLFAAEGTGYGPVTVEYPPAEPTCTAEPSTESSVTTTTQPQQMSTTTVTASGSPETLPYTGFSTSLLASIGAAALALGAALVGLGQRRKS